MSYKYCAAIAIRDYKVLLLKRSDKETDEIGKWCPVNETIEENESPENAVVRGVKEEIGSEFTITKQLPDHVYDGRTAVFLGLIKGKIKLNSEEVTKCGWFSYREAITLDFAYQYDHVIQNLHDLSLIK